MRNELSIQIFRFLEMRFLFEVRNESCTHREYNVHPLFKFTQKNTSYAKMYEQRNN